MPPSSDLRWLAAVVAGCFFGLAPLSTLGALLLLGGAVAAALSLEGRPGPDLGRGALIGVLWALLNLGWLPGAWDRYAGSGGAEVLLAAVALQAALPAAAFVAASTGLALGLPRSLALGLSWVAVTAGLGEVLPLPLDPALALVAAPALAWPAALAGRATLAGVLMGWGGLLLRDPRLGAAGLVIWAGVGLAWLPSLSQDAAETRVGILQPGTGAFDARRGSTAEARADKLLGLAHQATAAGARWLATPEGAWPHDPGEDEGARRAHLLRSWSPLPPVILGATLHAPGGASNSLLALEDDRVSGRFDKVVLVPLAERAVGARGSDRFRPGEAPPLLRVAGVRTGPLICYEVLHPQALRARVRHRPQVLVAATNDAWLGATRGAELHLAAARLAALESGRWVVRPAASGISALIDPAGRVQWRAPWVDGDLHPEAPGRFTVASVPLRDPRFSGATLQPWAGGLAAGLWLLLALALRRRASSR